MSNVQSYNALIDRFKAFASGHFILKRFSHGQIEVSDLEKFGEYPFMHVVPSNVTYTKGMKTFSFQIVLADLPRDKEEKPEYQREVLSDLQRIAEDLIAEITNHRVLFGDLITVQNVSLEPFLEEFQHTLTGWTISLDLLVPYYWDACSIPAEWNDYFETGTGGTGSILSFADSITQDENGVVTLVNDEAEPSPNYYYGTNDEGVRGWYLLESSSGLTCVTLPSCQTIIDIEAAIDDLQTEILLKANTADISAVGFSNNYNDLSNKPTIPAAQVNSDWNATSGVAEILNKPTIPTTLPPSGAAGGDLTGTYPNPTVHRVHGVDFQSGAPAVDDTWIYVSTPFGSQPFQWQHSKLKTSQVQNDSTVTGINADDALEHLDSTKVPTTRTLTINGTTQDLSADRTFSVGTFNLPALTSGSVLFSNGTTIAQDNANLFWDDTNNRLGIGTATPAYQLSLAGSANIQGVGGINLLVGTRGVFFGLTGSTEISTYLATSPLIFSLNQGSTPVARFSATNGNLLINTTTDAGFKLDVNGTARVSGTTTITPATLTGSAATSALDIAQTWNTTGAPIALKVNITDTASAALSDLMSLQVGGSARFRVLKSGFFIHNTGGEIVGNLVIGGNSIDASSQLEVRSVTKGFLPPRMTTAQKNAIASPAAGLVVYDTTLGKLCVRTASSWETITSL